MKKEEKIKKQIDLLKNLTTKKVKMLKGSLYITKKKNLSKKFEKENEYFNIYLFTYFKTGKHFSKYIKKSDYEKVNEYWKNYLKYYNEKKKLKDMIEKYFEKLNNYAKKNLIDINLLINS